MLCPQRSVVPCKIPVVTSQHHSLVRNGNDVYCQVTEAWGKVSLGERVRWTSPDDGSAWNVQYLNRGSVACKKLEYFHVHCTNASTEWLPSHDMSLGFPHSG